MGLVPTPDNAGTFLRRVDKSQIPAALAPNAIYGAFAINSARGFINQVYTITEGSYEREKKFGRKDYRYYGVSAHDLDKFLESGCPAYVVRAGTPAFKLAGFSFIYVDSPVPNVMNDSQYADIPAMISDLYFNDIGTVFRTTSSNDTADGGLQAAKGSTPINGDVFVVTSAITVEFVANQPTGGVVAVLPWTTGRSQEELSNFSGNEFAHVFAKGEGIWANGLGGVKLQITPYTLTDFPDGIYQIGDTLRISRVEIFYQNISREVFDISMTTSDIDQTGASIYVSDKFGLSDYVGVVIKDGYTGEHQLRTNGTPQQIQTLNGGAEGPLDSNDYLNALSMILDYPESYDAFLAVNAGCEIDHTDFDKLVYRNGRSFGLSGAKKTDALYLAASAKEYVDSRSAAYVPDAGHANNKLANKYSGNNFLVTLFNQWVLTRENESGQDIYISPVGYAANVIGAQARDGQLPYAPAGYRRGNLSGAKGLSRNWSPAQRLKLVEGQWNPIKADKNGTVFWDELTTQTYKSAFSDSHVALSYLAQLRGIENSLRGFEFEFNDRDTVDQILAILRDLADAYVREKYAEEIIVDDAQNVIGSDQIRIRWNIRFKGVARTIVVDVIAYPSTQELSVSMSEV